MMKYLTTIILAVCMMFPSSCIRSEPTVYSDDRQKAIARMELVVEAIVRKDKEALKAMFSEQALGEAEDLDGRMDYLFEFIQGDIKSWDEIVSGAVSASNSQGHKAKKSRSWFNVSTAQEEYLFFILEYTENTDHPENVGIYMLQVIKAEDKDTQFDGGQDILCAGIYKPDE